ncbi:hypothetical protein [Streptomyces sp. NPDC090036]|uniref:hypothetical protein n=1 Tax=Streptomyces sp. NPDC090036 TaxID=3365926 RepID=UPI0038162835
MTHFFLASLPQSVRPDSADPHARMWLPGMVFLVLGTLLDVGCASSAGSRAGGCAAGHGPWPGGTGSSAGCT